MNEIVRALVAKPLLWLLSWVKRNPGKSALIVLLLIFLNISLYSAIFAGCVKLAEWIGGEVGKKILAVANWLLKEESRLWAFVLLLLVLWPPVGWFLFIWSIVDRLRNLWGGPKMQFSQATE